MTKSERYWQNWDKGEVAKMVDEYWLECESYWRKSLVSDIKVEFGKKVPLLDVGCGTGLIYQQMLQSHVVTPASYMGGDVSENMLDIARQRFPEAKFVDIDIFNLPYPDQSQPNVICIHVLQHLPYYDHALNELMRITGRKLYIASWFTQGAEDELQFTPKEHSSKWGQSFYKNRYSLSKFLTYILTKSGRDIQELHIHQWQSFKEKKVYSISLTFAYAGSCPSRGNFVGRILDRTRKRRHSLGLTASQLIRFREKLVKAFNKTTPQT